MLLNSRTIWNEREMPFNAICRGASPEIASVAQRDAARRPARTCPVIALTSVVLPDAVRPDQPEDLAGRERQRHAGRAPSGPANSTETSIASSEELGIGYPAKVRRGTIAPALISAQGAGSVSGCRQPRNVGLPPLSSTITAALLGTWPSSAVP